MTLRGDADRFYLALLRHEREASREMARAYGVAWRRVRQRLDALLAQMAAAREAGQDVSLSWLFQQQRLEALQQQIETEMRRWASVATERATELQRDAVDLAQRQAEAETLAALGPPPPGVAVTWKRLSKEALTDLVGFASDGTPLRQLLDALGAEASQQVREALIAGMATGENPRSIARRVKEAFGGDLVRALRVSRTETMRAYRTAALRNYRANDDVVKGWIWNAACDDRTCAACWAMHGTKHPLDDELQDHPNGRCAASPWTKSWEELGIEGMPERPEMESGEARFAKLTPEEQDKILGKAGGAAYRAGAATLEDFATTRSSARWGTHVQRKSLKGVLGEEKANAWTAATSPGSRSETIGGVRVTAERRLHWRERHPEITAADEVEMLPRTILHSEYEQADPKDSAVIRRYAQDDAGKWWRATIKTGEEGGDYLLTFHRVQKPGR